MNNWRLLLLAVVAVLQPIGSFTESNHIDGRECCDHRSSSANQDTRLNGNYRKSTPEDHYLSTRGDFREEIRHEVRNDPIIRSRERLTLDRAERPIPSERAVRFSGESRFARDLERSQRTLVDDRNSRRTRDLQNRRTIGFTSGDTQQHERDVLDTRRVRMSRVDTREEHIGNQRSYKNFLVYRESRTVRNSQDLRHLSPNRETTAILRRERGNVVRDQVQRDYRITLLRSVDLSRRDNNRARRFAEREEIRSRVDSREDRGRFFIGTSERFDERDVHYSRVDRTKREISQTSERVDKRQQQRNEMRLLREKSLELNTPDVRRQVLARESRNLNINLPTGRIVGKERREAPGDARTERRQDSRVSMMLETTSRSDRHIRDSERRHERTQSLTRSLDQISILRSSLDERSSRGSVRFPERNVRDVRVVRDIEIHAMKRQQSDDSQISNGRIFSTLQNSRDELRQSRRGEILARLDVNSRSDQESRIRNSRSNERFDKTHYERDERRVSRENRQDGKARETEQRNKYESSRMVPYTATIVSNDRLSRNREGVRRVRFNALREVRDENMEFRDRTIQRQTRDMSEHQQRHYMMSRNSETDPQLRRIKSVEGNRREVRERDENRISKIQVFGDRNEEQRRKSRSTTRDSRDIQNVNIRSYVETRTDGRLEVREQRGESRLFTGRDSKQYHTHKIFASRSVERRSREHGSRDAHIRSERLTERRDDMRIKNKEVRNNLDRNMETRLQSKRLIETAVLPNRQVVAMERSYRKATSENRDERVEAKLKYFEQARDVRTDTRREDLVSRFRNFDSKVLEVQTVEETSEKQNNVNWQMVFYTLQGAYLCGFMMQMLTEKSNKYKSRNFTWWFSSKNLVKVD